MRGSPADRAQRKFADTLRAASSAARLATPVSAALNSAARRQRAIAALAAVASTSDIEALTRIITTGTPLWMLEQLAAVANNAAHSFKHQPNKERP